jgi:hypothetical protein
MYSNYRISIESRIRKNTTKQRENNFWKTHQKSFRVHLRVAVTVPTGSHAFPSADLVPVDGLLRPPHTQTYKIREQATQHDTSVECSNNHLAATQGHGSDDGAQTPHAVTAYKQQPLMGSPVYREPTMFTTSYFAVPSALRHDLSHESLHRHPACYS